MLVEAMIGLMVGGIVIAAVYAGVGSGFQTMQLTRENLRATQIMVERLEAIRGCRWSRLNTNLQSFVEYYTPTGEGTGSGVPFHGEVTLRGLDQVTDASPVPTYADTNIIKAVTVTLRWTNHLSTGTDLPRTRSMTTFVSEYGLRSYVIRKN